jgi:hypothetical protein
VSRTVVFVGPSIAKERLPEVIRGLGDDIELRPPVKQGDILRALADGAAKIGIIDGYFDQVPSVWHKEILFALEQGVAVYGAASMGALRAAELHDFGMIGVGSVFEMYRDGILEDDDEVALVHSAADDGFRPISEAMVNLRDLVDSAVTANEISRTHADEAIAKLKAMHYPQRSVRKLVEIAPALVDVAKLRRIPMKERDAVALLERLKQNGPARRGPRVERTIFLERLRLEIRKERARPSSELDDAERQRRRDVLLGLIATEHASTVGASATNEDVEVVVRDLMVAKGFNTPEALGAFLEERRVDANQFLASVRAEATVRRLELLYAEPIDALAGAREDELWWDW